MNRYIIITFTFMLCSVLVGCISFKPDPLLPPENLVDDIQLCKKIEDAGDLLKPSDIQSEFTSKDDRINCFIKLKYVSTRIQIRWKWYSPGKSMVRDTGNIIINKDEKYLEVVTAYDMFKIDPENIEGGQWTVVIFVNDKFIGKKTFQIRRMKKSKFSLFLLTCLIFHHEEKIPAGYELQT